MIHIYHIKVLVQADIQFLHSCETKASSIPESDLNLNS